MEGLLNVLADSYIILIIISVLLVLASEHYDESDYIRNYDKFLKEVRNDSSIS